MSSNSTLLNWVLPTLRPRPLPRTLTPQIPLSTRVSGSISDVTLTSACLVGQSPLAQVRFLGNTPEISTGGDRSRFCRRLGEAEVELQSSCNQLLECQGWGGPSELS
jgi:hypothetical protein